MRGISEGEFAKDQEDATDEHPLGARMFYGNLLNISSVFHLIISSAELTFLQGHSSDYQDIDV